MLSHLIPSHCLGANYRYQLDDNTRDTWDNHNGKFSDLAPRISLFESVSLHCHGELHQNDLCVIRSQVNEHKFCFPAQSQETYKWSPLFIPILLYLEWGRRVLNPWDNMCIKCITCSIWYRLILCGVSSKA